MMINLVGGRHCSSWSPFLISHRQYYKLLRFNHRILGILTSGFTFNDAGDPITHVSFFFIEPSVRWLNRGWILEITLFLLTRIFENCKVTTITGRSPTPHVWWLDVLRIYYSHLPPPPYAHHQILSLHLCLGALQMVLIAQHVPSLTLSYLQSFPLPPTINSRHCCHFCHVTDLIILLDSTQIDDIPQLIIWEHDLHI